MARKRGAWDLAEALIGVRPFPLESGPELLSLGGGTPDPRIFPIGGAIKGSPRKPEVGEALG